MKIHILEDKLVNQISAGEVVERPESVLRELLDNSIDAGASRIQVLLEKGGQRLLKVTDNGAGMSRDDAILAFERHATSKIRSSSDLKAISTLGFRGEALASISSVSKVTLRTREPDDELGSEVEIRGGDLRGVKPIACPVGTEIEVRNLFFNTPARRKFLSSERTEIDRIKRWLSQFSMAYPEVAFRLTSDGREILNISVAESFESRAKSVMKGASISFSGEANGYRIEGLLGHPSLARSHAQYFCILVNKRLVRDMMVLRSVKRGFDSTLKDREFPVGAICIDAPYDLVDVNVHPQKAEVRFQESRILSALIEESVSAAVQGFRGVARWKLPDDRESVKESARSYHPTSDSEQKAVSLSTVQSARSDQRSSQERLSFTDSGVSSNLATSSKFEADFEADYNFKFSELRYIGQLFECYLLCELDGYFYLVDMHAAHERYNFNLIRNTLSNSSFPSQQLLVPIPLELFDRELELLSDISDFLARFGFELESFGDNSLVVRAVPTLLVGADVASLIREIASLSDQGLQSQPIVERIDKIAARLACHASIRSGAHLEREEVYQLLADLDRSEFQTACPHGRPLLVKFSELEVESWFGRDR